VCALENLALETYQRMPNIGTCWNVRWENLALETTGRGLDAHVKTEFKCVEKLGVRDFKIEAHVRNKHHALGKLGAR
jgi:hypothetical protein